MSDLKSIYDLVNGNYKFIIPSYQRGYRWTEREVEDLLEDILDFMKKPEGSFYCLQPLVVKRDEEKSKKEGKNVYRVIDGQQRLTTILLILKVVQNEFGVSLNASEVKGLYELEYEIRPESGNFLKNINRATSGGAYRNIDFWHMYKNYEKIKIWLEKLDKFSEYKVQDFINILLAKSSDDKKNIRFIWYEPPDENEIEIFTRLNIGKIPLTNSELIKAMFLLPLEDENEQALIISEWDIIESKLQDNRFWGFIYDKDKETYRKPTRIDFIFDLVAEELNQELKINVRENDERKSFYVFYEKLRRCNDKKGCIEKLWEKTKYYFRILEEFYEDNELYHLVGFLINTGESLEKIIKEFERKNRNEFINWLKGKIKEKIDWNEMEELVYPDDRKEIQKILYLFNVILTMKLNKNFESEMYVRFPFHIHKLNSQNWTLEHINPRKPEDLKNDTKKMSELLEKYKEDDSINQELRKKIDEVLETNNPEKMMEVLEELFNQYSPGEDEKNKIGNLVLLSRSLNSELQNYLFHRKKEMLINKEIKEGIYIPIGTKYAFTKNFPNASKNPYLWEIEDMEAYKNFIKEILKDFFNSEEENER